MKRVIASLTIGMLIGSATIAAAAPNTIQATLAKFKMVVNGETKATTQSQLVYNGTTYVALREAADLFGYEAKYDGTKKQIDFTLKDIPTEVSIEWISLYEFETLNKGITISQKDTIGSYKIVQDKNELFSLYTANLKDGEIGGTTTKDGAAINVMKYLGSILLNKEDLKEAGFKVN